MGRRTLQLKTIVLMLLAGLIVAACASAATPGTSPLASPLPGGDQTSQPTEDSWVGAPAAALRARDHLAQRLGLGIGVLKLVSAEQIDWPDACMGIETPGVMCAQVITPGYKVILDANGRQYEYHTDLSGDVVRPVD